ncbi:MAG: hypothetical protein ABL903_18955 [Methylococcales bacterium]
MNLRHLKNSTAYDPYWVIQADKNVIPSHAFRNQSHLWCFIDLAVKEALTTLVLVKR